MMYTKDFDIFKEMVSVAEKESLEYRVLYSNIARNATNDSTQCFGAVLCTNLFKVSFERTVTPEDALRMEQFLRDKVGTLFRKGELLLSVKVFKISIERSFLRYIFGFDT